MIGSVQTVGAYRGVAVEAVTKGSPADLQGIRAGDLILGVDGRPLTGVVDFYVKTMHKQIGEPIDVAYIRPAVSPLQERTASLTLVARPIPDGGRLAQTLLQVQVSELTQRVAARFGFDGAYPVLVVTDVPKEGAAAQAGLAPGDLILRVNGVTVRNMNEFSLEMEKVAEGDTVELEILRISVGLLGQIQRRYVVGLQARSPTKTALPGPL